MNKQTSQKNIPMFKKQHFNLNRNVISPSNKISQLATAYNQLQKITQQNLSNKLSECQNYHSDTSLNSNLYVNDIDTFNKQNFYAYLKQNNKKKVNQIEIILYFEQDGQKQTFNFPYQSQTTCQDLITFLNQKCIDHAANLSRKLGKEVHWNFFYYKSSNIHIDYYLTIPNRKIIELVENQYQKLNLRVYRLTKMSCGRSLKIFQIIKCIGSGGFSKVYLTRAYGMIMALKVIPKQMLKNNGKKSIIQNQKHILQNCSQHPFVTKLYLAFQTTQYIIFAMQYCNGGQLFNLLRSVKRMTQEQAKFYFLETLSVIAYLHEKKILYRDLKPENIILDAQGHIRLADYGLSKILTDQQENKGKSYSFCGSAEYMAPQMLLKKGHSYEIDYYCLGALLYELITGLPPYYSQNQSQLFHNILTKQLTFPENSNIRLSNNLKQFLKRLLCKNEQQRFHSIYQMFEYDWIKDTTMLEIIQKKLNPPFKVQMFKYNFDDSQFFEEEQYQTNKLLSEKQNCQKKVNILENFEYECEQIKQIQFSIRVLEQQKNHSNKEIKSLSSGQIQENSKKLINSKSTENICSNKLQAQKEFYRKNNIRLKMQNIVSKKKQLNALNKQSSIMLENEKNIYLQRNTHQPNKNKLSKPNILFDGTKSVQFKNYLSPTQKNSKQISNLMVSSVHNQSSNIGNYHSHIPVYTSAHNKKVQYLHNSLYNSNSLTFINRDTEKISLPQHYIKTSLNENKQLRQKFIQKQLAHKRASQAENKNENYKQIRIGTSKSHSKQKNQMQKNPHTTPMNKILLGYKFSGSQSTKNINSKPYNYQAQNARYSQQNNRGYLQSFKDKRKMLKPKRTYKNLQKLNSMNQIVKNF